MVKAGKCRVVLTCTLTAVWTIQKESDSSASESILIGSPPTVVPLCMGRTEAIGGGPLVVGGTGVGPLVEGDTG